ncbi:MAG: succinate dehydrogenase, hydrophobic membrane anchor protein [Gammaproteobacteria bacterium]|nr:succinate dehydrogenase, hydrophobic membrane anchor protein [Gammaproteobacteria bacterium]MDH5629988.1 succinate dehydrogenase, hydrophobic membrane anchor protein [Gammaproteobacteria bacterium]
MVTSATSLGRSGLHDWIIQRTTAVVLAAYIVYLGSFIFTADKIDFPVWIQLFSQLWFKIFSLLAIISLSFHAWVGLWIVFTDYVKSHAIRFVLQIIVNLSCLAFIIWGALILWSV